MTSSSLQAFVKRTLMPSFVLVGSVLLGALMGLTVNLLFLWNAFVALAVGWVIRHHISPVVWPELFSDWLVQHQGSLMLWLLVAGGVCGLVVGAIKVLKPRQPLLGAMG